MRHGRERGREAFRHPLPRPEEVDGGILSKGEEGKKKGAFTSISLSKEEGKGREDCGKVSFLEKKGGSGMGKRRKKMCCPLLREEGEETGVLSTRGSRGKRGGTIFDAERKREGHRCFCREKSKKKEGGGRLLAREKKERRG